MNMPWMHAPISHQMAFQAKNTAPISNFHAPAVSGSPIHEKTSPHLMRTQVHSGVAAPGLSSISGAAPSASNTSSNNATSLGTL